MKPRYPCHVHWLTKVTRIERLTVLNAVNCKLDSKSKISIWTNHMRHSSYKMWLSRRCYLQIRLVSCKIYSKSVASLGWVSPGPATEGVTPIFSCKNWPPFFSHHRLPFLRCHPYLFSPKKLTTFFCSSLSLLLISLGCHPPGGCHPAPFFTCPTPFVHYSLYICPQKFFSFGCHPLDGVTRGGLPSSPSDATAAITAMNDHM